MLLHPDYKRILRYAWSIKLTVLAVIFSAAETALPIIQPYVSIWPGIFAVAAGLSSAGAFYTRIVSQKEFRNGN